MSRVTVYRYRDNQSAVAEGWFSPDRAEAIVEANPMTAQRYADLQRQGGSARGVIETLYRTEGGQWVHKVAWQTDERGRWVGERDASPLAPPRYRFLIDEEALDWLNSNGHSDRAEQFFGDLPAEQGPGRPEIGGRVQVRLGDLLPSVDVFAEKQGCSRAEAVRRLVATGLGQHQ
ncbi:hypothetical protein [Jiangella alkaliphila]|uniref:Uncharacterized protein n=1 Tax=Jiangella alkaliphila TaxID=419479 RepID=A0A1H2LFI7_9ACTN|nr:hypothetical protein [Jiangella alkaliphila]SDU79495.1 hypothetical protein SAMN04488563_6010 [Jiangella alkaliphila]